MARVTRDSAALESTTRALYAHQELLTLMIRDIRPDAVETFTEPDFGRYRLELWGAKRASGGVLLSKYDGFHEVKYFDDARPSEYAPIMFRDAYARLAHQRQTLNRE